MADENFTRRDFARRLALGTGSLALVSPRGMAEDDDAQDTTSEADDQDTEQPPKPEPEDFLLASLMMSYPTEHLTDEMLAGIRAGLGRSRRQAERLRSVPLENSDEPAFVFRAYRKD